MEIHTNFTIPPVIPLSTRMPGGPDGDNGVARYRLQTESAA
jgi:hypothetical protein